MTAAADLCTFIDSSPTPFHVCATVAKTLEGAGYTEVAETDAFPTALGRYFVIRGGSLIAWNSLAVTGGTADRFRVVGGHTDSPNLRVKQNHDIWTHGLGVVALEPYGGAWLNSWLDRDLGISGRLSVRRGGVIEDILVRIDDPILRVPQLKPNLRR